MDDHAADDGLECTVRFRGVVWQSRSLGWAANHGLGIDTTVLYIAGQGLAAAPFRTDVQGYRALSPKTRPKQGLLGWCSWHCWLLTTGTESRYPSKTSRFRKRVCSAELQSTARYGFRKRRALKLQAVRSSVHQSFT